MFSFKLERLKWLIASIGWPFAFTFWFQIIVVLYAAPGAFSIGSLIYFHFLWIIIVCSFFAAAFTPPESIKSMDKENEMEVPSNPLEYCNRCHYRKPPRWHHCRRCNQCVHRMDHHCPILQLCIHNTNHKYYLLFLLWPLQLAIFTVYHGYFDFWKSLRSIYTSEVLTTVEQLKGTGVSNAVMVGIATMYLLREQIPNLMRNQTIIEEERDVMTFDLGCWRKNVATIMGSWKTAWLPIPIERVEKTD